MSTLENVVRFLVLMAIESADVGPRAPASSFQTSPKLVTCATETFQDDSLNPFKTQGGAGTHAGIQVVVCGVLLVSGGSDT